MTSIRLLYRRDEILARVHELADTLRGMVPDERPLLVSVLRGSVIFLADLVRSLGVDADVDFISISSYPGPGAPGVVRMVKDLEEPATKRHVVIVEDIVDTGLSLSYLMRTLAEREPKSLRVCTLVDKPARRIAELPIDLAGFEVDEYVVGYGLDLKGKYRNLPHLFSIADPAAAIDNPDSMTPMYRWEER